MNGGGGPVLRKPDDDDDDDDDDGDDYDDDDNDYDDDDERNSKGNIGWKHVEKPKLKQLSCSNGQVRESMYLQSCFTCKFFKSFLG